jgi:hypothetical protein
MVLPLFVQVRNFFRTLKDTFRLILNSVQTSRLILLSSFADSNVASISTATAEKFITNSICVVNEI